MINLIKNKSLSKITREWDAIANSRDDQISSGKDHSANKILAPSILKNIPKVNSLVDIGCGTGWLTERAAANAARTTGIDPSKTSISIAQDRHAGPTITYINDSVESQSRMSKKFDAAISNMAASCAPDLEAFLVGSRRILKINAPYLLTIPHPCFWPLYWGYASHPKFKYNKSFAVEGNFKIQAESTKFTTTHFHHPLEYYVSTLAKSRLSIESIAELTGPGYNFPRFILIMARAK